MLGVTAAYLRCPAPAPGIREIAEFSSVSSRRRPPVDVGAWESNNHGVAAKCIRLLHRAKSGGMRPR
jgi:hypothetical protein